MNKLTIQNEILTNVRLGEISSSADKRLEIFPYNNIHHLLEESINTFSRSQVWNWTQEVTDLGYFPDFKSYYLSDFDIDYNRVREIFFFIGEEKKRINRTTFKEFRQKYMGLHDTGMPQVYYINNDVIRFYPIPDKDYGIKIRHFKHIPKLLKGTDNIEMIPKRYQKPIPSYPAAIISAILDKENAEEKIKDLKRSTAKVKKINQQYVNKKNIMPSKIRW